MFSKDKKHGSVILEVLIAIGLSSIFFSMIAGLLVASNKSTANLYSSQKAYAKAKQGITAIQSMSFEDLAVTTSSKISYSEITERWSIESGIENLENGMTRSINISEVQRDENCGIVEADGTIDPDSFYIQSNINWFGMGQIEQNINLKSLRVNWEDPQGECFNPTDAGGITLDWSGGYWGGSKQLRGVYIINNSDRDIIITKMTLHWDRSGSLLQQIFAIGTKVWSDSGPGTPSGQQSSGTEIDVLDSTIPAGFTDETHKIQFTGAMEGATLIMEIEFADGSTLVTDPFTP